MVFRMRAYTHGSWAHRQRVSTTFLTRKSLFHCGSSLLNNYLVWDKNALRSLSIRKYPPVLLWLCLKLFPFLVSYESSNVPVISYAFSLRENINLCCCVPVQCVASIPRAQLLPIVCWLSEKATYESNAIMVCDVLFLLSMLLPMYCVYTPPTPPPLILLCGSVAFTIKCVSVSVGVCVCVCVSLSLSVYLPQSLALWLTDWHNETEVQQTM